MQNLGELLGQKTDRVVEQWIEAVRRDRQIEGSEELSKPEIRDHVPDVLRAIAVMLTESSAQETQQIRDASLDHGVLRAQQGFNPAEVVREYRLLRQTIFTELEPDLQELSVSPVLQVMKVVDRVIDQALTICFDSYVNERLQDLEELRRQVALTTEELSRLVRSSQEQVSVLAHELKTPLTSIIGYAELYIRQQQQQIQGQASLSSLESIERVLRNGRRLLHLINQILELAHYESSGAQLNLQPIAVSALIAPVVDILEPLAEEKGLRLIVDCDRAPESITTDSSRLQQVLTNLCGNAIRYTDTGEVRLTCIAVPSDRWQIEVADTGIGISPADQARIFTPYFQSKSIERLSSGGGTGLGLAIVAKIVQLLQGDIELTSQVGKGSTFTVTLPQFPESPHT